MSENKKLSELMDELKRGAVGDGRYAGLPAHAYSLFGDALAKLDEVAALEAKLEAFQRLLKAAQAEWAYRAPKHDYAWADSARYALIRQEFVDAVVEATLLDAGYNPDEVGQRMAEVARKAIAAAQEEQT